MYRKRIRLKYAGMTPGFRKIADYVSDHALEAAFLNQDDLAWRLDVDPTTLDYFARDIGYRDHSELKEVMQKQIHDEMTRIYQRYEETGDEESLLHLLYENTLQNLQAFFATETSNLAEVTRLIKRSRHIWLTGEHISYERARWLTALLRLSQWPASVFRPNMVEAAAVLEKMEPEDLLLTIALRIPSPDAGSIVRLAREKGLNTVTFTDCKLLCPAREAELVILMPMENPFSMPNSTVASVVVTLLWETVAGSPPEEIARVFVTYQSYLARLQRLRNSVSDYDLNLTS